MYNGFEEDKVPEYFNDMDNNTKLLFEEVLKAQRVQAFLSNLLEQTTNKVELKLDDISALIGENPIQLERKFDTPDLWGTVGEVASRIEEKRGSTLDIKTVMDQTSQLIDKRMNYTSDPNAKEFKYVQSMVSSLPTNTNLAFTKVSKEFAKLRTSDFEGHRSSLDQVRDYSHLSGTNTAEIREDMKLICARLTKVE